MRLSIIIPVYKVEQYLVSCLNSVSRQTFTDFEAILVDDHSPDHSGAICDEWSARDSRFRVIHNSTNKGLSEARNIGLNEAKGDFVAFVDSDDYVATDTMAQNISLFDAHPQVDVIEFPVHVHHGAQNAYRFVPGKQSIVTYDEWITNKGYLHCYAWNKIYRRNLWADIRFPKDKLFEDVYTIPLVLQKSRYILQSNKGLYYYCSRKNSISNTISPRGIGDLLHAHLQLYHQNMNNPGIPAKALDDLYLQLCNPQIVQVQKGGVMCIPYRQVPLRRALFTRRPMNYKLKAILLALSGEKYCHIVAKTRKVFKK